MNKIITEPKEIEVESFRRITEILGDRQFPDNQENIIKRVIHTSADFEYADNLEFLNNAVESGVKALLNGCTIITDTRMAYSGINKTNLAKLNCKKDCYIDNEEVTKMAKERGITRATLSMEYAVQFDENKIFAIGNAPTALIALYDLIKAGKINPSLIIGVPVGFVNVVESKEMLKELDIPYIVANGRKGGSNVAAAICNALMLTALLR